jgi:hypothetical protein
MMVADDRPGQESAPNERYRKGLPGYHDPTAGIGGAAPALSALTLRLWLAVVGIFTCTALAIWLYVMDVPIGFVVVLVMLAAAGRSTSRSSCGANDVGNQGEARRRA